MKFLRNGVGFTLIELLVAIAIIGVMATSALLVLNPTEQFAKGHDAQRKNDLKQLGTVLDTYYSDNNSYPLDLAQIQGGYIPNLPKDPLTKQGYCYQSNGNSYRLSAKLERSSDPQATPGIICNNNSYNYAITSTNTSVTVFGLPIETPVPPVPTSTPVPTSIPTPTGTPMPTATPTPCPTAGTCQIGGGGTPGNCIAVGNAAADTQGINCSATCRKCDGLGNCVNQNASEDLFGQCTSSSCPVRIGNYQSGQSCTTLCAARYSNSGYCNGAGGCSATACDCYGITLCSYASYSYHGPPCIDSLYGADYGSVYYSLSGSCSTVMQPNNPGMSTSCVCNNWQ